MLNNKGEIRKSIIISLRLNIEAYFVGARIAGPICRMMKLDNYTFSEQTHKKDRQSYRWNYTVHKAGSSILLETMFIYCFLKIFKIRFMEAISFIYWFNTSQESRNPDIACRLPIHILHQKLFSRF